MFHGSITALVTPFKDGAVDFTSLDHLIEHQLAEGTDGLVPCGTTGETPTLQDNEYEAIVRRTIDVVKGRVPVIVGTGTNDTRTTIHKTQLAKACGADAALIVTPYYNRPTQAGLIAHYHAVADECALPIILYDVAGRTGVSLSLESVVTLAVHPLIVGLKDAHADLTRPTLMRAQIRKPFALLSGEDGTAAAYRAQGGDGCISVLSNAAPRLFADMHRAYTNGDLVRFAACRDKLAPLAKALFLETSPAPIKYALKKLGLIESDAVRLPLLPATSAVTPLIDQALVHAGLLESSHASRHAA